METYIEQQEAAPDAPRSGAPAVAPFLDKGGTNLPYGTRPKWTKQQWKIRRVILERLMLWQVYGYERLWMTLTSSPESAGELVRAHFQVLRKRMARQLGFRGTEYVCVDTREGHGVLHVVLAWKSPEARRRSAFYIPFDWLQEAWKGIHGAFHVNVKRVQSEARDARRLSRYIVAQYCGGQSALVRFSQSKCDFPFTKARSQLRRAMRNMAERYAFLSLLPSELSRDDFDRCAKDFFTLHFKRAWEDLVLSRSCTAYGVQFVWCDGELVRV